MYLLARLPTKLGNLHTMPHFLSTVFAFLFRILCLIVCVAQSLLAFSVPPLITPFDFGKESVNSGDMASVFCTVHKGDFPINITWLLNGKPIDKHTHGISLMRTNKRISQLSIDTVDAEHAGEYVCAAANSAGVTSQSAYLRVNGIHFVWFVLIVSLLLYTICM